ncbi:hypothetical protein [Bacillus sp. PS06]|uniref:hypothetical protein n=1 Tax=Bacillus sp. PS06 TaxID=2764176 RepID=UPI00177C0538|nr:hypothetical protein [Bacillus sp. PS06]MBD8070629.1 hypothetical protein [Bacillus sp. PS06]
MIQRKAFAFLAEEANSTKSGKYSTKVECNSTEKQYDSTKGLRISGFEDSFNEKW